MENYRPRLIEDLLELDLKSFGAVLIVGPKWCGKTTTAQKYARSLINFQDPLNKKNYLRMVQTMPSLFLIGETPRLIDEWQVYPQVWDCIRQDVDKRNKKGLYILTGSNKVDKNKIMHSGIGRISRISMRSMTLFESGHSCGTVSVSDLFKHKTIDSDIISSLSINQISELVVRGGWPATMDNDLSEAIRQNKIYIDRIASQEIETIDGKNRDRIKVLSVLQSLARNTATYISDKALLEDITKRDTQIHINTLHSYLNLLADLYITEDLPSWTPRLRSKSIVRTKSVRHFTDPALVAALLNLTPTDLINDIIQLGLLFESLVIRDLRVYTQFLYGDVYHYCDSSGLEIPAIIRLHEGKWAAIEIKLGEGEIEEGAKNLIKLKNKVALRNGPEFMMIITGTKYGYQREDGIWVVPIGCLKP